MLPSKDNEHVSRPFHTIYANESPKTIAYIIQCSATFPSPMKKPVRPRFIVLFLIMVAATFVWPVAVRNGFGPNHGDGVVESRFWGYRLEENSPFDIPLFNSTLLKLTEIELGEAKLRKEIDQLLKGNLVNPGRFRTYAMWRKFFETGGNYARNPRGTTANLRSPEFAGIWEDFRLSLSDWAVKRSFQPNIMDELLDQVKVPIDRHNEVLISSKRKYSSCAVVGNSGILLSKDFGGLIDSHEAVIRLNNARVLPYQKNVGSKTSISFINSNILHLCTRRADCSCHPYGANVPIVMYMCQPAQFLDYVMCSSTHKSPLIVTDPRLDMLCARIVKYYSLKRFGDGPNKSLEQWNSAHDGSLFHYSSGMQAVTLALGICDRVSLFGFGKSDASKHHYHTNQKKELSLHDYEAEYDFYHDLVKKPHTLPFFSETFKFPPVAIHR